MDHVLHQGFVVGDYTVAPIEGRLYGPRGSRCLIGQTIQLLELLAEHPGELVERQQIIQHVCQGHRHPDRALTRCVSELRRCLEDDSTQPRYIETVSGHGYRLIAAVTPMCMTQVFNQAESQTHPSGWRWSAFLLEMRQRKVCRAALLYMLVVWLVYQLAEIVIPALLLPEWALTLVVLLGILGFPLVVVLAWALELTPTGLVIDLPRSQRQPVGPSSRVELLLTSAMMLLACVIALQLAGVSLGLGAAPQPQPQREARTIEALAVGKFVPVGSGPQSEALAHALVDELRHLLLETGQVQVMAADSTRSTSTTLRDLAADVLLEGSVNVEVGGVRATVHLVDPRTGYDIWSLALDEPSGSLAGVQVRLARRIAAQLPIGGLNPSDARLASASHAAKERFADVVDNH